MADAYTIDTNLYIRAFRDTAAREALQRFRVQVGRRFLLHAVVMMELRAGAKTTTQRAELSNIEAPFLEAGRVVVPSFDAFQQAGRILADLATREGVVLASVAPSLLNDALIAASCREHRVTLVTENLGDFTAIERHLRGFHFSPPWPSR